MSREPWFKFWAADYLMDSDVQKLPLEAQGLLLRMWCLCHIDGSVPADPEELSVAIRCKLQSVLLSHPLCHPFFEQRGNRLFSVRMEREKAKSEQARKNAEAKHKKDTSADGSANGSANGSAKTPAQKARKPEGQISEERESQNLSSDFELLPSNGNGHHDPARKAALLKVWAHYISKTGRSEAAYKLTDKRKAVGLLRLKDCQKRVNGNLDAAVDLMNLAIDKLSASSFHMGINDKKEKYCDWIDHLFKSEERMEKWWNA